MASTYIDHYNTTTTTPTTARVSVNHNTMLDVYSYGGNAYGKSFDLYNDFNNAAVELGYLARGHKKSFNAELQDEIDEWLNIFN